MELVYRWGEIKEGEVYYIEIKGWSPRIIVPSHKIEESKWKVATYFLNNMEILFSEKLHNDNIPNYTKNIISRWNSREFFDKGMFYKKTSIWKLNE